MRVNLGQGKKKRQKVKIIDLIVKVISTIVQKRSYVCNSNFNILIELKVGNVGANNKELAIIQSTLRAACALPLYISV